MQRAVVAILSLLFSVAGCFSPDYPEGLACSSDDPACPPGQECSAGGVCVPEGTAQGSDASSFDPSSPDGGVSAGDDAAGELEPSASTSSISGESGVLADGEATAEIVIELLDGDENPVAGIIPTFTASGEENEYEACSATDEDGIATCGLTSTQVGEKALSIIEPVEVTGETIEFVACLADGEPFGGGRGTPDDPFRICTPEQLNTVGDGTDFLESAFLLTRDINMEGIDDFNVIGPEFTNAFIGSFDGGGFIIENLTILLSEEPDTGLFGVVNEGGRLENLRLENVKVDGRERTGALVGRNDGTVAGVHTAGEVSSTNFSLGGLVGRNDGTIEGSSSAGTVTGHHNQIGGLVGDSSGTIEKSHADVEVVVVIGTDEFSENVGGLVGRTTQSARIAASFSAGDIAADRSFAVGGLVGRVGLSVVVTDAYATGDVAGDSSVGGFVGLNSGTIENAYAAGLTSGFGTDVAGFAGQNTSQGEFAESFWDGQTGDGDLPSVGDGDEDGVTRRETGDFDDQRNFAWDFDTVWTIGEAPDGESRPIFRWQE